MKILVVGAGAVGSVFGYRLHKGGAEVSFLVKPEHQADLRGGISLEFRRTARRVSCERAEFKKFEVFTDSAGERDADYVFLTMPSTGLEGAWLPELLGKLRPECVLVSLQPGIKDRDKILSLKKISEDRLINGSIPIVCFKQGKRFICWTPPLQKAMFQGPRGKIEPLVECLNRGGMPAKYSAKMREQMIVPSTILEVVVAGLEASHWSLEQLEEPQALALTCKAMKQALPIATKMGGVQGPHPLMRGALRPFAIRALLKQVSWMAPFDFEAYMKLHFTKVGRQMHEGIDRMIDEGSRAGFSVDALETLKSRRVETS